MHQISNVDSNPLMRLLMSEEESTLTLIWFIICDKNYGLVFHDVFVFFLTVGKKTEHLNKLLMK